MLEHGTEVDRMGLERDNGKENGSYYNGLYRV